MGLLFALLFNLFIMSISIYSDANYFMIISMSFNSFCLNHLKYLAIP